MSKELLEAVTYGDVKDVRIALRSTKFDINQRDGLEESTPIIIALYRKKIGMAKLILEHNPDINVKDVFRRTALHYAVKNNDIDHVEVVLAANPDVNVIDNFDDTPMDLAKEKGNMAIIDVLQKRGALTAKEKREKVLPSFELSKLAPEEIASGKNKNELEKVISGKNFIPIFSGLDYKRQEALLSTYYDDISSRTEVFEQVIMAMQATHSTEYGVHKSISKMKFFEFSPMQRG